MNKAVFFITLFLSGSCMYPRTYASDAGLEMHAYRQCTIQEIHRFSDTEPIFADPFSLSGNDSQSGIQFSSHIQKREVTPRRKSYIIGVGWAAIIPVIGHTYIGGANIPRGILYTFAEYFLVVHYIGGVLSSGENPSMEEKADHMKTGLMLIHGINIFDAYFSVKNHNERVRLLEKNVTVEPALDNCGIRIVWRF